VARIIRREVASFMVVLKSDVVFFWANLCAHVGRMFFKSVKNGGVVIRWWQCGRFEWARSSAAWGASDFRGRLYRVNAKVRGDMRGGIQVPGEELAREPQFDVGGDW
jgi:hypothetical protein